jgi:2-keto-4-pentenoate hydratase/2-oxohepta-3-ene-1,7-dioic acid hydratase in catechol pathway
MLLVRYRVRDSASGWHVGVMRDQVVVDAGAYRASASGAYRDGTSIDDVKEVLPSIDALCEWAAQQIAKGDHSLALESLELGPPVPNPDKILCLGTNYREHVAETHLDVPKVPVVFAKFRNSLTGPTSPIMLPPSQVSTRIDYEGELAVIIGKRCKAVPEEEALDYVAGYSIVNDVTARDVQAQTSQWTAGKALDTFLPMGPGIVPASRIPDPQALTLITRVNGQELQHERTANMIFSVSSAIAFLSSLMTLEPGDIIATGTPSGVGFTRTPPLFLQDGDVVEVEIEGIGHIRNPVKREA